jgi:hypothetical protein
MPKNLQIFLFKKRFEVEDTFDWYAFVDETLTFPENLDLLEKNHLEEIERAQHEGGRKTESEKRAENEARSLAEAEERKLRKLREQCGGGTRTSCHSRRRCTTS